MVAFCFLYILPEKQAFFRRKKTNKHLYLNFGVNHSLISQIICIFAAQN